MSLVGAVNYRGDKAYRDDLYHANTVMDKFDQDILDGEYEDIGWLDRAIWDEIEEKGLLTPALGRLDQLHLRIPEQARVLDSTQINPFSTTFYENSAKFRNCYREFVQGIVNDSIGASCYYQAVPTLRFHFPDPEGFGERPQWHADIMLGHPPGEINIWVPITPAVNGNTISILHRGVSVELLEAVEHDYRLFDGRFDSECSAKSLPVEMSPGSYLIFDPRCIHATQKNVTPSTRVSMDFRIIPVAVYERLRRGYEGGGRNPMPFAPGHYYAKEPL